MVRYRQFASHECIWAGLLAGELELARGDMPPYIAPEVKQRIGVWGAPTSTLDWCEENHVVTLFIAELCTSNIPF